MTAAVGHFVAWREMHGDTPAIRFGTVTKAGKRDGIARTARPFDGGRLVDLDTDAVADILPATRFMPAMPNMRMLVAGPDVIDIGAASVALAGVTATTWPEVRDLCQPFRIS